MVQEKSYSILKVITQIGRVCWIKEIGSDMFVMYSMGTRTLLEEGMMGSDLLRGEAVAMAGSTSDIS